MSRFVLVTGGARSGKSTFAERLAASGPEPVLYVATAEAGDAEMAERIAEHRRRRPSAWSTLEAPSEIALALGSVVPAPGTVLLEDLGLLASNLLLAAVDADEPTLTMAAEVEALLNRELLALDDLRKAAGWSLIVVTNEVGFGVVPPSPLGRVYRDLLGRANQTCAARADTVYLVVAGIPLCIKRSGEPSSDPIL